MSNSRDTKAKNHWNHYGWYLAPGDASTHKDLQIIHVKRNLAYKNAMETVGSEGDQYRINEGSSYIRGLGNYY